MDDRIYPLSITTNDSLFVTFKNEEEFCDAYKKCPGYFPFAPKSLERVDKKIFSESVKIEDSPVKIEAPIDVDDLLDDIDFGAVVKNPQEQGPVMDIDRVKRKYTKRQ